jgi:hypothetical protein
MSATVGSTRRRMSVVAVLVLACCGACTSDGPGASTDRPTESTRPRQDLPEQVFSEGDYTDNIARAGLGNDAAFIRLAARGPGGDTPVVAAVVDADGVWSVLPLPEVHGQYALATAGGTIVLGGLECDSHECTEYTPRFLVLSDDRAQWFDSEVDLPSIPNLTDSQAVAVGTFLRPMGHAQFRIGADEFLVSSEGVVIEPTYAARNRDELYGFSCRTDDLEIQVPGDSRTADGRIRMTGMVRIRDLDRYEEGFVDVAPAWDVVVDPNSGICGFRQLTVQSGATSYTFDVDTNQWTESRSNYPDLNSGSTETRLPDYQVGLVDRSVFQWDLRRAPDGTWSRLPEGLDLVFTIGTTIYAIESGDVRVFQP